MQIDGTLRDIEVGAGGVGESAEVICAAAECDPAAVEAGDLRGRKRAAAIVKEMDAEIESMG